ncbi:MAG: hypothetical protein ACYS76_01250 [Planctomycetota bacterium]
MFGRRGRGVGNFAEQREGGNMGFVDRHVNRKEQATDHRNFVTAPLVAAFYMWKGSLAWRV